MNFLYSTPLGRAYLIALLIIVTRFNCYLGLLAVVFVALIHNSTDTLLENFKEGADGEDEKTDDDKEEKKEENSVSGALLGKIGLKKEEKKEEKDEEKKEEFSLLGNKTNLENYFRPKQSKQNPISKETFSLKGGNPAPITPGKEAFQGLGFSAFN